ncbi:unnamed protein product [Alternaria alternata]|uniref:Uncharacterized protein n=3 Tax=Alternaria sect. Alternaria TaxID=2499237 RepID=A0A177D2J8_ALTAL|nr:hypothetical protein CC77DRAFT_1026450 [Alternaria alternata]KAB2111139.1 hypothetical protein AG0111_0g2071 [Alternaria gaisen]RII12971.1 hypothetical protein CUC08_Gglean005089 [Alternaria sp. MG1]RYN32532.1 hypothetical protein AA0115_g3837 [Alternaria tenuissima]KAH6863605.1 hypothetical protein B0T12DRAFT_478915 [Alternaria alternata]OAG13716.1 hypothetical protein CC77DRAFT_1026450 [Alternaria alternata]
MPSVTQARLMWRSVARGMVEPHPFARNPITMTPHAWRAADLSKKVVKTSTVFFPFYAGILGWPVAAAWWFNGNM